LHPSIGLKHFLNIQTEKKMTPPSQKAQAVRKLVVFFDICSSTTILEDLLRTENQERWRNLHISIKKMLQNRSKILPFEIYKFLGDGWVLLFDEGIECDALLELLSDICLEYDQCFHDGIFSVLESDDHRRGITMGIDIGTLVRFVMNGRPEYVGRPLNVAARLQAAVKDVEKKPEDKLLISKNAFDRLNLSNKENFKSKLVRLSLRNIAGGSSYQARRINLL